MAFIGITNAHRTSPEENDCKTLKITSWSSQVAKRFYSIGSRSEEEVGPKELKMAAPTIGDLEKYHTKNIYRNRYQETTHRFVKN